MNGNISDKFETTGLRFLAHVLQYPMVFTVIYVLYLSCCPMWRGQPALNWKMLWGARSFELESIFSFASQLLLICWNISQVFPRAEDYLFNVCWKWIVWLLRAFPPLTFYDNNKEIPYYLTYYTFNFKNMFTGFLLISALEGHTLLHFYWGILSPYK